MARARRPPPRRREASGRKTADRVRPPPSSRGCGRDSCAQRNKRGAPERLRRPRPAPRWREWRAARERSWLRPRLGDLALIPVENLLAVPVHHAFVPVDIVIDRFEIFDPERLAGNVGVDRNRYDLRPFPALRVEPVETVDGALEQMIAAMVLHQHHRNII